MVKIALITGIGGQDGSITAELLLNKGYIVHGIIRRTSNFNTQRIDHIFNRIELHYGDLTDSANIFSIIAKVRPHEIYNFAAQSHVKVSSELENYTFQANTIGVLNILQAVKLLGMSKFCKIYQASTSEEFGNATDGTSLLNELSPKMPVSVYGISKLASEHLCRLYRDAYDMFIVSSTLFNHESERRGHTFVTQKIANYVSKYNSNIDMEPLQLGNLDAMRDWGCAKSYCEAIYLMMQNKTPDNYVIATGETHSVREFVQLAFKSINIETESSGTGKNEVIMDKASGKVLVVVNPKYYRDLEINCLIGDAKKAKRELGWEYTKPFEELVDDMVKYAIQRRVKK